MPGHGARAGVRAAGGQVLADLTAIAALGAIALLEPDLVAALGTAVGVLAGLTLAVLGFLLMDRKVVGALSREQASGDASERHENPVVDRYAATVANPGWYVFWLTAGLALVRKGAAGGVPGIGALAAGFVLPALVWPTFIAVRLAGPGRDLALADRQYRILTSLGGLALVAVGFWLGSDALAGSGVRAALTRAVAAVFGGGTQ